MKIFSPLLFNDSFVSGNLFITGAIYPSLPPNTVGFFGTASYALTASYVLNGGGGGPETDPIYTAEKPTLATTGSNIFTNQQTIQSNVDSLFLVKNNIGQTLFMVSQSGITQYYVGRDEDPLPAIPDNGQIYFTTSSFYVSLD